MSSGNFPWDTLTRNVWYNPETGYYEETEPGQAIPVPEGQTLQQFQSTINWASSQLEYFQRLQNAQVDYRLRKVPLDDQEIDQVSEKNPTVNAFKVGADPEFVALNPDGSLQNVSAAIGASGPIGWDHGGRVLELRPTPSRFTSRLLKNLHTLLASSQLETFRGKKWRAGGTVPGNGRVETLGGHVHFDLPWHREFDNDEATLAQAWSVTYPDLLANYRKCKPAIAALDKLTRCFESLDILPAVESNSRRHAGGGYGRFGDVRECSGHLEYRTPASWLFSPATAYWVLTGYKLAAAQPGSLTALPTANYNWTELLAWYKRFASQDVDARRACEKLGDLGLSAVQGNPDADIRETWRELPI